jgi:hypothetical protein
MNYFNLDQGNQFQSQRSYPVRAASRLFNI